MKVFYTAFILILAAGAGALFALQSRRIQEPQAGTAYVRSIVDESVNERTTRRHRPRDPSALEAEEWLTRFVLTERSGETVRSEDLKGQPYVVGFFFSLCPSICVNQNAKVKELQEKFRGQPVRLLSISCDPDVDRPEVLREYAQRFDADPKQWLFLTGDLKYITRVAAEMYFLSVTLRSHAEKFVLVDGEGNNVGFYSWSDPLQFSELERDIQKLLVGEPVIRETVNAKSLLP